jgi:precorrin-3B synthase
MNGQRRGWCPGLIAPMQTGDGLLVRLRFGAGRLTPEIAAIIADAAGRYGNGAIDLSARSNLQLRGMRIEGLAPLAAKLREFGLADADAAAESVRNIIASPASDLDPDALIDAAAWSAELEAILHETVRQGRLPAKFSLLVDDGGAFSLDSVFADIRLRACRHDGDPVIALAIAGRNDEATRIGLFSIDDAVDATRRLVAAASALFPEHRPRAADCRSWLKEAGLVADGYAALPDRPRNAVNLAETAVLSPPFGRLDWQELREIARRTPEHAFLRLTPARSLLIGRVSCAIRDDFERFARSCGFIVEPDDPLRFVSACVGMPGCANATTDVRQDARLIAGALRQRLREGAELHVSGCTKGCARSTKASVTLTGENGYYRLGFDAIAGEGAETLARDEMLDRLLNRNLFD